MRNVNPIDIDALPHAVDAALFTEKARSPLDLSAEYAADMMREYLKTPIDELNAITTLLFAAEMADRNDLCGYSTDELNAIMLPRIHTLARACRDRVSAIAGGKEPDLAAERD
jgi:hypothetical protein